MKPLKVDDFDWHSDPAASGVRFNAYYPPHPLKARWRLCAYDDGRFFVDYRSMTLANGSTGSGKRAKELCVLFFNYDWDR